MGLMARASSKSSNKTERRGVVQSRPVLPDVVDPRHILYNPVQSSRLTDGSKSSSSRFLSHTVKGVVENNASCTGVSLFASQEKEKSQDTRRLTE